MWYVGRVLPLHLLLRADTLPLQRSNDKTANRTAEDVRTRSSKRAPESTGAATNTTPNAEAADTPEGDGTARSDHKDRFFPEPPVFGFACGQRIRGNRTGVV
jgi:hypothetical protein